MKSYAIIGLMSGTSMDGVDVAHAEFYTSGNGQWKYSLKQTSTYPYPPDLLLELKHSINYSAVDLLQLDKTLGKFFASVINDFIQTNNIKKESIDCIASHGHTIFHQPKSGFTYQIGCGDTIAYKTNIKVINDFRQKDVVAGGQGAPLVPIGDLLLFGGKTEAFLNIGGITNICIPSKTTLAYDICPGNLPLNRVMNKLGKEYDNNGELSSRGKIDHRVLSELNNLPYYSSKAPKSLGVEWLKKSFYPLVDTIQKDTDQLNTIVDHITTIIVEELNSNTVRSVMITGGGAKNQYLINCLKSKYDGEIILPSYEIIDFKEALIFGFLGALYLANEYNTLASVTGAKKNTTGGVLHIP